MKLLVLDENYPHLDNLLGDVFVHVRVKEYVKKHQVQVFSFFHNARSLNYEGVDVRMFADIDTLKKAINNYNPDRILIHFYQPWMLDEIIKITKACVVIWVHGYEALGWYRRLFNYTLFTPVFFRFVKRNMFQQYQFHRLIAYANKSGRIQFIFVSKWMKMITATDSFAKISNYHIIPNPIDTRLFSYLEKSPDLRKKILLLRSFGTRKYANDISVTAILKLSEQPCFKDLSFTIIGEGALFDTTVQPLRKFLNISIRKGAVRQKDIPQIHAEHGVFLCPTRQDAQGVSMCEAMSSGLVVITSDNTAIPEFVTHLQTGMLTKNADEVAYCLKELFDSPTRFNQLSKNAADSIRHLCNLDVITAKELEIIKS